MLVLVINCGSSSLKFQLVADDEDRSAPLPRGAIERIGTPPSTIELVDSKGVRLCDTDHVPDHADAGWRVIQWLDEQQALADLSAVGHRVVHGGSLFAESVLIDKEVIRAIDRLGELAPLHNPPALASMKAVRKRLGDSMPMVAVFDTAFHQSMPAWAAQYAIDGEWARKHQVRRYGFHGTAHRYLSERYDTLTGTPNRQSKLISLQLGNGCSATAVQAGESVDTSMGLTPLEGLMMGTRSGDVDPTLAQVYARREGVAIEQAEIWLNSRCGLLGVSGSSSDMRDLLAARSRGEKRAALAVQMYCYRVRKMIGAYLAALGGAEAVVFGGGIGENSPEIRRLICAGMEWCGLQLDPDRNKTTVGLEGRISTDEADIAAYVIPVDEALCIARETMACLETRTAREG